MQVLYFSSEFGWKKCVCSRSIQFRPVLFRGQLSLNVLLAISKQFLKVVVLFTSCHQHLQGKWLHILFNVCPVFSSCYFLLLYVWNHLFLCFQFASFWWLSMLNIFLIDSLNSTVYSYRRHIQVFDLVFPYLCCML